MYPRLALVLRLQSWGIMFSFTVTSTYNRYTLPWGVTCLYCFPSSVTGTHPYLKACHLQGLKGCLIPLSSVYFLGITRTAFTN